VASPDGENQATERREHMYIGLGTVLLIILIIILLIWIF
jgi:flagellar biogenesis protein FliO